jgi:peptidoglycan/LPS O-acetylase OafA/YrhL
MGQFLISITRYLKVNLGRSWYFVFEQHTDRGDFAMRFEALDGWRGLCALAVALIHLEFAGQFYDVSFVRNSYLFVDFFFVLSGFVITHSTWGRINTSESLFGFVLKRFARL